MNLSQRLRTCAKHTGLDAVIELLTEAADEIDRLSAGKPADVTDEQIVSVMRDGNNCQHNDESDHIQFARAILALRPVQVPMTREQVFASDELMSINGSLLGMSMRDLMQMIHIIEAHHGITAQAKKEQA